MQIISFSRARGGFVALDISCLIAQQKQSRLGMNLKQCKRANWSLTVFDDRRADGQPRSMLELATAISMGIKLISSVVSIVDITAKLKSAK